MIPCGFTEENGIADTPDGVSPEDVAPLSIYVGHDGEDPVVISCWKITADEWDEIAKNKRIWLVVKGLRMPPMKLEGLSPFIKPEENHAKS